MMIMITNDEHVTIGHKRNDTKAMTLGYNRIYPQSPLIEIDWLTLNKGISSFS